MKRTHSPGGAFIKTVLFLITAAAISCVTYLGWTRLRSVVKFKRVSGMRRRIVIKRDRAWYEKQRKYTPGATLESVSFQSKKSATSDDVITRNGTLLLEKDAPATILMCHGFMTSKDDMGILRWIFKGYNVMTFDFRAHGEDVVGQCCTFGGDEMYDVIAAAEFLKENPETKDKPLIVYGFSMGAVASILAQAERPDLFSCAIWDCPFDSAADLVARSIDRMNISIFGYNFGLPGRLLLKKYAYHPYVQDIFKTCLRAIVHMDATQIITSIRPVSPKEAIKKISIPSYFITCHNDDKAPPSALLEIYKNSAAVFKRLWIAAGRRHFDPVFANPEKYAYKVRDFIKTFLNGNYVNKIRSKIKEDPCIYEVTFVAE